MFCEQQRGQCDRTTSIAIVQCTIYRMRWNLQNAWQHYARATVFVSPAALFDSAANSKGESSFS